MELKTSRIHRRLDAKMKVGGIEAADLLVVLILTSILNLILGQIPFGPIFIFGIPALLLVVLYFGKRGKPEGYLLHAIRFHLSDGDLAAGGTEEKE